jgi:hypothetical protein
MLTVDDRSALMKHTVRGFGATLPLFLPLLLLLLLHHLRLLEVVVVVAAAAIVMW